MFEFIGVMDLLRLGQEAGDEEVWYDVTTRMLPDERRDKLIPADRNLIKRASWCDPQRGKTNSAGQGDMSEG